MVGPSRKVTKLAQREP
jgi:hypothetical protein